MKIKIYQVGTIIWGLTIGYFSLLPRESMVTTNLGDKVEHFLGYAMLSLLANLGWRSPKMATVFCIGYGILIEIAQGIEGSRTPSIADAIANSLGVCTGLIFVYFLAKRNS